MESVTDLTVSVDGPASILTVLESFFFITNRFRLGVVGVVGLVEPPSLPVSLGMTCCPVVLTALLASSPDTECWPFLSKEDDADLRTPGRNRSGLDESSRPRSVAESSVTIGSVPNGSSVTDGLCGTASFTDGTFKALMKSFSTTFAGLVIRSAVLSVSGNTLAELLEGRGRIAP